MAFTCFWGSSYTIVLIRIAALQLYFKAHLAPPFFKIFVSPPLYSIPPTFNTLAQKVNIFIFGSFATDKWQICPFEKNIIIHLKEASSFWYTGPRTNIFVILGQTSNLFKVNQYNINFWRKKMYNVPRVQLCLKPGEGHREIGSCRRCSGISRHFPPPSCNPPPALILHTNLPYT